MSDEMDKVGSERVYRETREKLAAKIKKVSDIEGPHRTGGNNGTPDLVIVAMKIDEVETQVRVAQDNVRRQESTLTSARLQLAETRAHLDHYREMMAERIGRVPEKEPEAKPIVDELLDPAFRAKVTR